MYVNETLLLYLNIAFWGLPVWLGIAITIQEMR
jgi:hypothetical protein